MPRRDELRLLLAAALSLGVCCSGPAVAQPGRPTTAGFSLEEQNVLKGEELFRDARAMTGQRNYARAADKLKQLIRLPFPSDPAASELMAGAHASLAEVLLLQRSFREADAAARGGLAYAGSDQQPTYLRADLYDLLAQIAAARGDSSAVQDLRRRASEFRARGRR